MKVRTIIAFLATLALGILAFGQEKNNPLPDVPAPTTNAIATDSSSTSADPAAIAFEQSSPSMPSKQSREPWMTWAGRHSLDLALAGSLGYDMYWSRRNMTHPLMVTFNTCDGPGYNTLAQCLADPNHTIGTSRSGIDPKFFSEKGWTKIFGGRNVGMTIAGQTVEDALLVYLNNRLSKKGRMSRMIGMSLVTYKIVGHLTGAYSNIAGISYAEHLFVPEGAWNVQWF